MSEAIRDDSISAEAAAQRDATHIERGWERCLPWLVSDSTPEALLETRALLLAGKAQLWPGERSVMVTQCISNDRGRVLQIVGVGGDGGELLAMQTGAFAWGRALGCEAVIVSGADDHWRRLLKLYGFEELTDDDDRDLWRKL